MVKSRPEPNLTALNDAVARAAGRDRQRLKDGLPQPVVPLVSLFDERGVRAVWNAVGLLRDRELDLYNKFVGELNLFHSVLDVTEEYNYDGDLPMLYDQPVKRIGWSELLTALQEIGEREWLVGVALANAQPPDEYVELGKDAGLIVAEQDPNWQPWGGDGEVDPFAMRRHLGERLSAGVRWRRADDRLGPLDTRRTAVLALLEQGSGTVAVDRAKTRARYALAVWCLQHPPDERTLWPTTADWEPRPFLRHHTIHKDLGPGGREHGRVIDELAVYELAPAEATLRTPFSAMDAVYETSTDTAEGWLHARATLAAASSLYAINRQPRDHHRTEELLLLQAAVEAICDAGPDRAKEEDSSRTAARWLAIADDLEVWKQLRGTYSQRELNEARHLTRDLRNIAAHGSDQVLLNLGYPDTQQRKMQDGNVRLGQELSVARMSAAVPVLRHAVEEVTRRLADYGRDENWDDEWFAGLGRASGA